MKPQYDISPRQSKLEAGLLEADNYYEYHQRDLKEPGTARVSKSQQPGAHDFYSKLGQTKVPNASRGKSNPKLQIETSGDNSPNIWHAYRDAKREQDLVTQDGQRRPRETPLSAIPGSSQNEDKSTIEGKPSNFGRLVSPGSDPLAASGKAGKPQNDGWMPDKDVLNCSKCTRKFTLWLRKHHCRLCNRIFCKKCSFTKMRRHERVVQKIRLCIDCDKIQKEFAKNYRDQRRILNAGKTYTNESAQQNSSKKTGAYSASEQRYRESGPSSPKFGSALEENDPVNFERGLRQMTQREGVQAASAALAQHASLYLKKRQKEHEEDQQAQAERGRARGSLLEKGSSNSASDMVFEEEDDFDELDNHLDVFLRDIREKVMREFKLDEEKWSALLEEFVNKAIFTVKPSSFVFRDSIDITKYIKIQLVQFKDTSKSKYLNGVVINKSIAHKRMKWDIQNPRILLLSNSLGYIKDEEDFMDLESEIKQEESFIQIIMKKIELVNPNLIFVQNDTSMKAIEALLEKNITLITNVKESVMQRIGRFTQTISCASTNLITPDFILGKCERFSMESLAQKTLNKTVEANSSNVIQLEGCLAFLGCTMLLSGPDMTELKLVKHALKKILRMSRQLILENEYYQFFGLSSLNPRRDLPVQKLTEPEEVDQQVSPFLHHKHLQRSFLIFKEVSYSKSNHLVHQQEYEDTEDKEIEINQAQLTEKDVQSRINMVCSSPTTTTVHLYDEKENDTSLICKLRQLCPKSVTKCRECNQFYLYHTVHYFHREGYVEMKMRFSKDSSPNPEQSLARMKQSQEKSVYIQCQCEVCKVNVFPKTVMCKQLQEMSFYSFLEQFFYNNSNLRLAQAHKNPGNRCPHPFHSSSKIIFLIDIIRIEFQYHLVDTYQLDLVCFKELQGSVSLSDSIRQFLLKKQSLQTYLNDTIEFLLNSLGELDTWLFNLNRTDLLHTEHFLLAQQIITNVLHYIDNLCQNMQTYHNRARDAITAFKSENELYLNKLQKAIASRVADYILLAKSLFIQVFDELIPLMLRDNKKISKKDLFHIINQQLINHKYNNERLATAPSITAQDAIRQPLAPAHAATALREVEDNEDALRGATDFEPPRFSPEPPAHDRARINKKGQAELVRRSTKDAPVHGVSHILNDTNDARGTLLSEQSSTQEIQATLENLLHFEDRLKKQESIKQLMKMSPAIPDGFDMDCTLVDENDFSTIICQAHLSNDFFLGLKEQRYMGLDQKMEKTTHVFKNKDATFHKLEQHQKIRESKAKREDFEESSSKLTMAKLVEMSNNKFQPDDFYLVKGDQDVLDKEVSQKDIETELLRLDQYHFQIELSNYKAPAREMTMVKDNVKKVVKVDRKVLQSTKPLEDLEPLMPCDLDRTFYAQLNETIVQQIFLFKMIRSKELKQNFDQQPNKVINQNEKYLIHTMFFSKADISIKLYFPSHFMALRKLYCGGYSQQNEAMFKSCFWSDNTGGKSKSDFYKSINEKYVLKVISNNEIRMFNEFGLSYFEYMCRSFTQKCPTSIAKILGAYKIKIKNPDKKSSNDYYVILMENLTCGIDSNKEQLAKYDLKGSMLRRYVLTQGKSNVTKLDTNFLEEMNSRPIVMEYTMNRLMRIAIHNDTNFLSKHEKIDYSFLVWIDHETKLIRVGIIDYIQYYSIEKMLESKYKTLVASGKNAPTIQNPNSYKIRFQRAMNNYFLGILRDKPCESFASLVRKQMQLKKLLEVAAPEASYKMDFNETEPPNSNGKQEVSQAPRVRASQPHPLPPLRGPQQSNLDPSLRHSEFEPTQSQEAGSNFRYNESLTSNPLLAADDEQESSHPDLEVQETPKLGRAQNK